MRSLQDYIDIYKGIANKLNLQGDSVELLSQMLANASYISEVENITYAQEASLEKASLMNSKIQHCVDQMYSVFRGSCPRVIIHFKPTTYLSYNIYDEVVSSNSFKAYYLGYYNTSSTVLGSDTVEISGEEGFEFSPITVSPAVSDSDTYTIMCLLAKETVSRSWTLNENNTYYVNCIEDDLSGDFWVKINDEFYDTTRQFSDHILNASVFDLTLPNFGSRLYVADIFRENLEREETQTPSSTTVEALYYKYSLLSSYNTSELKKINIRGAELVDFDSSFLAGRGYSDIGVTGLAFMSEVERDNIVTIHYRANRDRFVNSILRSNSDIGTVLEETYPDKIITGGTTYEFTTTGGTTKITIYYVPYSNSTILTEDEKESFVEDRIAYYVTDNIEILRGSSYTAVFNIDVEIYQNSTIDDEVADILDDYANKFGINFSELLEEIKSLISKISNVKLVSSLEITYVSEDGSTITDSDTISEIESSNHVYYSIDYIINTTIETTGRIS